MNPTDNTTTEIKIDSAIEAPSDASRNGTPIGAEEVAAAPSTTIEPEGVMNDDSTTKTEPEPEITKEEVAAALETGRPAKKFCGFETGKAAIEELALLKIKAVGDNEKWFLDENLKIAAAVKHFEKGEFLRLIVDLKKKGKAFSFSHWLNAVEGIERQELDRLAGLEDETSGDDGPETSAITLKPPPQPWSQPVDAADLFAAIEKFIARFVRLTKEQLIAVTLWVVFTYVFEIADVSPRLAALSPKKRCGKSTLLRVLMLLCRRVLAASNISPSATFRAIDLLHPTLVIDEVDTFAAGRSKGSERAEEMRGILNSGHTRDLAFVIRNDKVGDRWVPRQFSTWAPIAYAAIRELPDTWMDRSIVLRMRRRLKGEPVDKMTRRNTKLIQSEVDEIVAKLVRWSTDNLDALRNAPPPAIPNGLNDRSDDNWDLLLSIADLAGPEWGKRTRAAAQAISGDRPDGEGDSDLDQRLLADLRQVFEEAGRPNELGSKDAVTALLAIEGAPWSSLGRSGDREITTNRLARMLAPFEVYPKHTRYFNGYARADLEDLFGRYLSAPFPENASETFTSSLPQRAEGGNADSQTFTDDSREDSETDNSTTGRKQSEGVRDQAAENGSGTETNTEAAPWDDGYVVPEDDEDPQRKL